MVKVEKLKFQRTSFFQLQRGAHTFSASKGGVHGNCIFKGGGGGGGLFSASK